MVIRKMSEDAVSQRKANRLYSSCKYQRPCWKNVRAPIARKNHIFLPYICSYQTEGDLEKCGIRDTFIENDITLVSKEEE